MKTSELKKWLEDNKWKYDETAHYIEVLDLIKVFTESQVVKFNEYFYSNEKSLELIKVVIEYTNTPISEREDEKKYRVELAEICEGVLTKDEMRSTIYTMSSMVKSSNETKIIFNKIFTQKEIDNFPAEIKGAIECGFLRKVEVE